MGPSPTLVAPGLRTADRVRWTDRVTATALAVKSQPGLWVLGGLGYLLRGGAVVLTLAILVLPSPVSVRLMLGTFLGSSGLTPQFYVVAGFALGLLALLALLGTIGSAFIEVASFERLVSRGSPLDGLGRGTTRPGPSGRRRLLAALVLVQLAGLLTLALAAVPVFSLAAEATFNELMRPNLAGGALYDRVLGQLGRPIFGLLIAVVIVEMVTAVASRRLIGQAYGLAGTAAAERQARRSAVWQAASALAAGLIRPIIRPLPTLPTAILGWLVMLAVLAPLGWALALVWSVVRTGLLAGPADAGWLAAVSLAGLLSATWLAGLACAGIASAVRAALWTTEALR